MTAAVDAGGDRTGARRLAGDTDLHRAVRLCGHRRSNRCTVVRHHADRLSAKRITVSIGDPHPQHVRHCAVCHYAVLNDHQISDLRRPDIGDKCHVPALAAVVDAGSDSSDSRRLTGDRNLHRAVRLRGDHRSDRCAIVRQHADRLPAQRITERIRHPHPQRVRRRTVCH